jgi:hypothetical protein
VAAGCGVAQKGGGLVGVLGRSTGAAWPRGGVRMTTQERSMLWAMAFYVFFDSLKNITSLVERFMEAAR